MYPGTTGTIYYYLSVCIPFNTLLYLARIAISLPSALPVSLSGSALFRLVSISSLVHLSLQHVHRQKVSRLFAVSDAFLNLLFIGRVLFNRNATGFRPETRPTLSHRRQESRAARRFPEELFDPVFAALLLLLLLRQRPAT